MAELIERFRTTNDRIVSKYIDALGREQYRATGQSGSISAQAWRGFHASKEEQLFPPPIRNYRVTGTLRVETDNTTGTIHGDRVTAKVEISGVFQAGNIPTKDDIRKRLLAIDRQNFGGPNHDGFQESPDMTINITDPQATSEPATGWSSRDSKASLEFENSTYDYRVHPDQTSIERFR